MSNKIIENKVIVITGGATGIGLEITKHFLLKNAKKVIILDVNDEKGKETEGALNTQFGEGKVVFIKCDVAEDFERLSEKIFIKYGPVDVLVNNAGIVDEQHEQINNMNKCIDINLKAVIHWSYKFLEKTRIDQGGTGGVIFNIASILGFRSIPFAPIYQATKHGIIGFTRGLGDEANFAITGVRVIAMCPGFTRTNLGSENKNYIVQSQEAFKEFLKKCKLQDPEVVGAAAVEIFEKADSGSAWLKEGGNPITEIKFIE